MNDNQGWQVGDLAMCVVPYPRWYDDVTHEIVKHGPEAGSVSTVTEVFHTDYEQLVLKEWSLLDGEGWEASAFIKVTPPEADEFDREIIDIMRDAPEEVPE